jgi:hypothetical protein
MQGAVYGKCIVADYNNVYKDKCKTEFMKLKDCYLVSDPWVESSVMLKVHSRKPTKSNNRHAL